MKVEIRKVSETEYINANCEILFEDKNSDRMFAIITNGIFHYKFGWQSNSIEPFLLDLESGRWLIAIDLNLVIVDFQSNKIIIRMLLDYFFYEAKVFENFVFIVTELEIIKMSLLDFSIIADIALPDYFEKMEKIGHSYMITCSGGEMVVVD